jgi:hypothetical protein
MKGLSIAAVLVLLVGAFIWARSKPDKSEQVQLSSAAGPNEGELGPYFTGREFHYAGTFYEHNFSYVLENEGGTLSNSLSENKEEADVWTAREAISIIVQQPSTKKFAIIDPSNPETKGLKLDQIKFQDAPQESDVAQGWARASSPESFSKDRKKGKTQNWVFVESAPTPTGRRKVYVGDEVKNNAESGLRIVPLLEVFQTHYTFFFDPNNKKFAPVQTDEFGVAKEEIKYRDITPGGVGEAVLKVISNKPPKQ